MKKILFIIIAALLVTGMFLSGCGTETQTATSTATTTATSTATSTAVTTQTTTTTATSTSTATQTTATTTTTTAAGPKRGGTLRWIFWMSPKTPGGIPWELFGGEILAIQTCYNAFFNINKNGQIQPVLAESYKIADDLKSITLNLRKGVKFIDGTDFNASAAKWNMDKTIATKQYPYWQSVDIIDDYTIKLNLTEWSNTMMSSLSGSGTWMISPTAYEKNGEDWARNNPTGTGPFKFASFEQDVSYKVVRNPDYWEKGKPILDGITALYISDSNTIRMAIEAGTVDCSQIEAGKTAANLRDKGFTLNINVNTTMCMLPDTAHEDSYFANKLVREAVEYAIDREAIADAFSYGLWEAPYQVPAASSMGYNPNFTLARQYDQAKAQQLLADAGYPNGIKAMLGWPALSLDQNIALAVQADLLKVGIEVELDAPPVLPQYFERSNTAHNELFWQPIFSGANWNSALSMSFSPTQQFMNKAWLRTPEFLEMYNKTMTSKEADSKLMWDVSNYMTSEAIVIPVMCGSTAYLSAPYVMDGNFYSRGGDWAPESIWLNK